MEILFGLLLVVVPTAAYVLIAVHPSTAAWSFLAYLAALAVPLIARACRGARVAVWVALAATLAAGISVPKMMWAVRLDYSGFAQRQLLRDRIEAYHRAHGAFPATLEELGPVPVVRIWASDAQEREHLHPMTRRVTVHPGLERSGAFADGPKGELPPLPAALRDDGSWGYDPETGRVFTACSALHPKLRRRPLFLY